MGFWGWWILGTVIVTMVFIAKLIHGIRYPQATQHRGTKPGQGDSLAEGGAIPGGSGGGYISVTRVPKDPQEYAREMMPRGKK